MHSMYGGMFAHVCCHILSYYLRATSVGEEIDTIKLFSHHAHYVCAIVADTWALHTSTSSRPVLSSSGKTVTTTETTFASSSGFHL